MELVLPQSEVAKLLLEYRKQLIQDLMNNRRERESAQEKAYGFPEMPTDQYCNIYKNLLTELDEEYRIWNKELVAIQGRLSKLIDHLPDFVLKELASRFLIKYC